MDSGTEGNIEDETNVESGDEADNEELSSNSKGSVEGSSGAREERLSEAKKPKLEMEAEAKTDTKKNKVVKKGKMTRFEKSFAVLTESFKTAAEQEMDMLVKLENMRQKEMLVHEIRLKELENERRREERQHELMLVNLLSQNRNPFQRMDFYEGSNPVHSGSESSFYEM